MKIWLHVVSAVMLVLAASCDSAPPSPYEASHVAFPEDVRHEAEAFGKTLEGYLHEGQTERFIDAIDLRVFADAMVETSRGVLKRRDDVHAYLRGMLRNAFSTADGMEAKFMGVVSYQGKPAMRFRWAGMDGIAFRDYAVGKDEAGKLRMVNFFDVITATDGIDEMRRVMAIMLDADGSGDPTGDCRAVVQFQRMLLQKNFAGVVAAYRKLPPELQQTKGVTTFYLGAMANLGDGAAYRKELLDAAARFRSPNFQLMLVDAYCINKEFGKAAACVDAVMQAIGKDAALLALKNNMLREKGDVPAALAALREALRLEPDCVFVHQMGVDTLLKAKEYRELADSLRFLEKQVNWDIRAMMAADKALWQGFLESPESAPWRE